MNVGDDFRAGRGVTTKPGREIPIFIVRECVSYPGSKRPCFIPGALNPRLGWEGMKVKRILFLCSGLSLTSAVCLELPGQVSPSETGGASAQGAGCH